MYASADDPADFYVHDLRFHRAMARACGNPILATMAESLLARANGEARIAQFRGGELKGIAELHRSIYRAIRLDRPADAAGPLERCIRVFTSHCHAADTELSEKVKTCPPGGRVIDSSLVVNSSG